MSTITLTMLAETQGINRGIQQVNSQLGTFGKTAGKVGGLMRSTFVAAGAAVAGAKIGAFLKDSVTAASDLNETISKTNQIFGSAAPAVLKFSETAATSLGQTRQQALDAASTFATFGKSAGLAGTDLSKFAKQNTVLASDLASFFNTEPQEAIEAIGAAFRGEAEPIRKYGVLLDDATLRQQAFKMGLIKTTSEALTPQQKVLAAQAQIMKQTKDAQGDFARTSGGLANQQRILAAQFENVKAKIGAVLLPVVLKVVTALNTGLGPAMERLGPVMDVIKDGFSSLQDALAPVGDWLREHPEVIKGAAVALGVAAVAAGALALAMGAVAVATSPITLTVAAIAAIGGGFAYAYKNSEAFRNGVDSIVNALKNFAAAALPIIRQVVDSIKAKWQELAPAFLSIWNNVKSIVTSYLSIVKTQIQTATAVITAIWNRFGSTIVRFLSNSLGNVVQMVKGAFNVVAGIFKTVAALLKGDWKGAWNGIKQIVKGAAQIVVGIVRQLGNTARAILSAAWKAIQSITKGVWNGIKAVVSGVAGAIKGVISAQFNAAKSLVSNAWNAVKSLTSNAWDGIKNAVTNGVNAVINLIKSLPGKITGALSGMGSLLYNAGKDIIQGLLDGIGSMIDSVQSKLGDLTDMIPDWKGPPRKDKTILFKAGQLIIQGLIDGFEDGRKGIKDSLSSITDLIEKAMNKRHKSNAAAKKAVKRALKSLADETKALMKNAKLREKVYARLAAAEKRLDDLRDARKDYLASVKESALDFAGLTNLNSAFTPQAMAQQLQARLDKIREFNALLQDLVAKGLNKDMIAQLASAGVEGGLAYAQALASGDRSAIAQFNSLQDQINTASDALGTTAANDMYNAGIKAADGLVKGLEDRAAALEKVAKRLARNLAQALQKALGGKGGGKKTDFSIGRTVEVTAPKTAAPARRDSSEQPVVINLNGTFIGGSKEQVARWLTDAQAELKRKGYRTVAI